MVQTTYGAMCGMYILIQITIRENYWKLVTDIMDKDDGAFAFYTQLMIVVIFLGGFIFG